MSERLQVPFRSCAYYVLWKGTDCIIPPLSLPQSVLQQGKKQADIRDEARDPCILSYLADCDFDMSLRSTSHSLTETTEGSSFSSEDPKGTESRNVTPPSNQRALPMPLTILQDACVAGEQQDLLLCQTPSRRTLDILQETTHADPTLATLTRPLDQEKVRSKSTVRDRSHHLVQQRKVLSAGRRGSRGNSDVRGGRRTKSIEKTLQEVLLLLKSQHPSPIQLEELEYQLFCIRGKLKVKNCQVLALGTYPFHSQRWQERLRRHMDYA